MKIIANNEASFEGIPSSYEVDTHNVNFYKDWVSPGPQVTLEFQLYLNNAKIGDITFDKRTMSNTEFWTVIDQVAKTVAPIKSAQLSDGTLITKKARGTITLPRNLANNKIILSAMDAVLIDTTRGRHSPIVTVALNGVTDTKSLFTFCDNQIKPFITLSLESIYIEETGERIFYDSAAQPLVLPETTIINIDCSGEY